MGSSLKVIPFSGSVCDCKYYADVSDYVWGYERDVSQVMRVPYSKTLGFIPRPAAHVE